MTSTTSEQQCLADIFSQFSFHHSMLLKLLAVMGPLSKTALMAALNDFESKPHRINHPELDAILDELQQSGWIAQEDHRWQLTPDYENRVILRLLSQPDVLHTLLDN